MVIELKVEEFRPEFAGKMNFYLSAVDDLLRHPDDQPSIGIILCQGRNEVVVEYALRDTRKPMGVARYTVSPSLPAELEHELPTAEDIASEMPTLTLLRLRLDAERQLRARLEMPAETKERFVGLGELLNELERRGLAPPSTARFREDSVLVLDRAVQPGTVGADRTERALASARRFPDELDAP